MGRKGQERMEQIRLKVQNGIRVKHNLRRCIRENAKTPNEEQEPG